MKHIVVFVFVLISVYAIAQESKKENVKAIKLYNQFSYNGQYTFDLINQYGNAGSNRFGILHPSIAIVWRSKKRYFHEIELANLNIAKPITEFKEIKNTVLQDHIKNKSAIKSTAIAIRYEYIIAFANNLKSKWVPSLGIGLQPYLNLLRVQPIMSSLFPIDKSEYGMKFFIAPRLSYSINNKFFIDLNMPINTTNFYFQKENYKNPSLPIENQKTDLFGFLSLPNNYNLRLGLGMYF